jgi:hypothetical protein
MNVHLVVFLQSVHYSVDQICHNITEILLKVTLNYINQPSGDQKLKKTGPLQKVSNKELKGIA